jgi:protein-S-isoprenylcysteine O-methyltransferase Ste14
VEFAFTPSIEALAFWVLTALWLAEFYVFRSRLRCLVTPARWGPWRLALVIASSFALTGACYHFRVGNLPAAATPWVRWGALGLYGGGIALRYWAASCLGPWFSRTVGVADEQPLVSHGPYALLRHPLYLGLLLTAVGMSLLMANAPGSLLTVLAVAWALHGRMEEEEAALESRLGTRYAEWKSRRYRLVPFVY